MDTSHLREHIVADDGLIRGYGNTTVTLHQTGDIVELVLADIRLGIELVLKNHLHTRQRCIATTLSQTVHRHMKSLGTTEYSGQGV